MSTAKQLQVNVMRGPTGLSYAVDRLPEDEHLLVTMMYGKAERGPSWVLQKLLTTGAAIIERSPQDEKTVVSLNRVEECVLEHVARLSAGTK